MLSSSPARSGVFSRLDSSDAIAPNGADSQAQESSHIPGCPRVTSVVHQSQVDEKPDRAGHAGEDQPFQNPPAPKAAVAIGDQVGQQKVGNHRHECRDGVAALKRKV
jgi:hypothetical protein